MKTLVRFILTLSLLMVFIPEAAAKPDPPFRVKELGVVCWNNGDSAFGFRVHNEANSKRRANWWHRNTKSGGSAGIFFLPANTGMNHWIRIKPDDPIYEFDLWAYTGQGTLLMQKFKIKPLNCDGFYKENVR